LLVGVLNPYTVSRDSTYACTIHNHTIYYILSRNVAYITLQIHIDIVLYIYTLEILYISRR